jgi:hypothetical protein
MSLIITITALALASIGGGAHASAADGPVSHVQPESPQRTLAEEWVGFVDRGNQRGACELQVSGQVHGSPCASLPTRELLQCPQVKSGQADSSSQRSKELVRLPEQLGVLTQEGPDRAYVVLNSRREGARWRGALGVETVAGAWRITYLRQGTETFPAAADVWYSRAWHRIFYPAGCPKRSSS